MKLDTDRLRVLVGRTELKEGSYEVDQLRKATEGHDWREEPLKLQVVGNGQGRSNWLNISQKQFIAIQKIMKTKF